MWKSSTVALRNGSAYCDRPIQLLAVLPRLDGCRVIAVLVATAVPLTYNVPVLPDSVTARCDHVFSGSALVALRRCSPPLPLVVMAKRGAVPALTVRNMFAVVPVPKSNTRDQVVLAAGLTQTEMVKLDSDDRIPDGIDTYSLAPESLTA